MARRPNVGSVGGMSENSPSTKTPATRRRLPWWGMLGIVFIVLAFTGIIMAGMNVGSLVWLAAGLGLLLTSLIVKAIRDSK